MAYQSWEINSGKITQRIYSNTNIPETWRMTILSSKYLEMIKKGGMEEGKLNYMKFMEDSVENL